MSELAATHLDLTLDINGDDHHASVEPRLLLSDFIRHEAQLTGTNVACEHGTCGACTVLVDGVPVRSCLMFAVQARHKKVQTVESVAPDDVRLHALQAAFREAHGLQCGFCTPGILLSLLPWLETGPDPDDEAGIRRALSGNLCRCTGYQNVVAAVRLAIQRLADDGPGPTEVR